MLKAEGDLRLLNVGFGGVIYRGVAESEAAYIGWGGRERLTFTPGNTLTNIIFSENTSHTFMGYSLLTHNFLIYWAFVSFVSSRF